ncbi:MAG: 1-phosphofructokinase family hexose kinase [Gammaproteobacteria bacterium]
MPKIITVTANTAIDYSIQVADLVLGDNIKAQSCIEFASGKGINVAKAVESLDYPVYVLGLVGRQTMNPFNELKSDLFHVDYTSVDGSTRTNITLYDSITDQETHIRTSGFSVTETDCQKLIDRIDAHAWKGDIVVLSGSLPEGARPDLYQKAIEVCHKKSAIPFLDSSGEGLKQGLKAKPYLVKPNQQELEALIGRTLKDEQDIVSVARDIVAQGVRLVVVSRGEKGVIAVFDRFAEALWAEAELEAVKTKIGCGDVLVAGIAVSSAHGHEPLAAIKWGVACATANLLSIEPGRFDRVNAEEMNSRIVNRSL